MFQFSFGIASLVVAAIMTGAYLIVYCFRHVGAYINRSTPPQERVPWYVGILLILGLVVGSMRNHSGKRFLTATNMVRLGQGA